MTGASDRAALVALYDATGGRNWSSSTNWNTNAPLGQWHGVTTDGDGRVVGLWLSALGLTGRIPAALGDLSELTVLGLPHNRLTGSIPAALGNLGSLKRLFLVNNQLTGPIPDALGNLTSLTELSLSSNQLTGPIPDALGNLTSLRELVLYGNRLTRIPDALGRLGGLANLDLRYNEFSGRIPAALGSLTRLETLVLHGNDFSGPISAAFGNLTRLSYLRLDADTGLCLETDFPPGTPFARLARRSGVSVCVSTFTDDPVVAGETPVRALHFTELRARIDALRVARGLGGFPWTDPAPRPGVTPLRAVHMTELRSALGQVYEAAGSSPGFSTDRVHAGEGIRAWHINELRRAVKALEQ